jgi:hypothetical protein
VRGFVYFDDYDVEVDGRVPVEVQEKHNMSAQTVAAVRLGIMYAAKAEITYLPCIETLIRDVSTLYRRLDTNRQSIEITGVESRKLLPQRRTRKI